MIAVKLGRDTIGLTWDLIPIQPLPLVFFCNHTLTVCLVNAIRGNVYPGLETGSSFPAECQIRVSRGSGRRTLPASSDNSTSRVSTYLSTRKSSPFLVDGREGSLSGTFSHALYQARTCTCSAKNCG